MEGSGDKHIDQSYPPDHHREVRLAYLGGFSFLVYEGALWLLSAALGSLVSIEAAIVVLIVGGTFSYFGAQLIQKLMSRPPVDQDNPLLGLSTQAAFIIPLCYPVIAAAAFANINWFFPAFAVVVGAHYTPYAYIYRMRLYFVPCGVLVAGGTLIGYFFQENFSLAGYFVGAVLLAFGGMVFALVQREESGSASS